MRHNFVRRTAGLFAALVLASCFGDSTGPGSIHQATLSFAPSLDREAALLVPFDSVRITLRRPADNSIALDTTIFFPANVDTVALDIQVAIQGATESFNLDMDLIDATGAVVFHAGPIVVTAKSSGPPDPPPTVPFIYVGVGSNATGVRFVGTQPSMVFIGDTALFVAEAVDASNTVVLGTPIRYSSSDTSKAKVPSLEQGRVAGRARGTASISASLLPTAAAPTPPTVNGSLLVQGKPATVVIQTGNGQSGGAGSALAQPIVARVNANDGLGVQGIVVNFAVTAGGGSISPLVATTDAAGDASTVWTLGGTLGPQSMTATAVAPNLAPATVSFGATAVAGTATRLAFTTQPATVGAGQPISPAVVVVAQDAFGNTATTFSGQIAIAIGNNPGAATLSGTTTVTAAAGVATFSNLILSAPSPGYTLLASATGLTAATSGSFTVQSLNPTHMTLAVQPSNTTAGGAITPAIQVELRDAANNIVTSSTATITMAIGTNPSGGTLSGTASVAAVNGVATFSALSIDQAGTGYTLVTSSTGLPPLTTAAFDITPAAPAQLAIGTQPSNATAGQAIAPAITVQIRDAFGNLVSSATNNVTLAILNNPGGGTLSGTAAVPAAGGVATFTTLSIDKAGTGYTMRATSGALTAANTAAFDIAAAAPTQLVFTAQPPSAVSQGSQFTAGVSALDAFGNLATGFSGNVTIAIGANPGGSTLGGTTTVAATAGVASFTTLTLSNLGFGYTLDATATGLTGATSAAFDVGFAASVNHWTNPAGGNWSVAANWSKGTVPAAADTVAILLAGTYTVNVDVAPVFSSLFIGGSSGTQTLAMSSRTLTSSGSLNIGPRGALSFVASTANASLAVNNQGLLVVENASAINGTLTTAAGATIRVQGNGFCCGGTLTVASGFTNLGAIELTSINGGQPATLNVTSGTLINAPGGTISALAGTAGGRTLGAELDNQGLVTVNQALTLGRASALHSNSGTIALSGGDLTINQSGTTPSFTNTATLTVGAGRTLTINSGTFTQQTGATLSGGGALTLNAVSAAAFNTAFTLGALNLTSTTASFATAQSTAGMTWTLSSATLNGPGSLTNAAGQTLALTASTISATMALDNQGLLVVENSSAINGTLTTAAGATIRVQGNGFCCGGTLTVASGFTNLGAIELTSINGGQPATLNVTSGTLTNAAGGTISSLPGTAGGRTLGAELDNQGLVTVNQALTLGRASALHSNSGTIALSGGDLTISQSGTTPSFTNTGTLTVGAGRTLTINSGTFTQQTGATLSGGGALTLNAVSAAAFNTAFTLGALNLTSTTASFATAQSTAGMTWTLSSATLNGPGSLTNAAGQTLALTASTISATMALDNQGLLVVENSSAINGTLTTAAGATIRVQGNGFCCGGTLTVASGFTNLGAIELTSINGGQPATLNVTSGTLINAPGGTISALAGTAGGRTLGAELDNQGLVTVNQALTLGRASALHSNSGTIALSGGDLTINQSGTTPSFTNTATLTVGAGRTLTINSGTFTQQSGATLSGGGALTLNAVSAAAFNTAFTLGALNLTSTTASFATAQSTAGMTWTLSSATLNGPGSLTNAAGQTLALTASTISATMALDNQGLLVVENSSAINGTLTTAAGATIRVQGNGFCCGGTLTVASGFTNLGAIELTSINGGQPATLNVTSGTLINAPGRTISALAGTAGGRTLGAELDNQGLVTVNQALTLGRASALHSNSGTIALSGGDLTINQSGTTPSFTNTGTLTVGAGRTLTINSGAFTQQTGATLSGGGALTLNNVSAAAFNTAFTLGALNLTSSTASFVTAQSTAGMNWTLSSATINGPGSLTNAAGQTLALTASTIAATMALDNLGLLVVENSSAINGILTTTAGSTLRVQGNGFCCGGTLTVAGGFTNLGAIELTSINGGQPATLNVTSGTLTNAVGGTISSLVGTGGGRTLGVELDNQGLVTVNLALTLGRASAVQSNSGTISVSGGDLTINQSGTTPSFTSTGTLTVGAGRTLTVSGGVFTHQSGATLSGGGALTLTSVSAGNFNAAFTLGALNLTSSTASFATAQSTAGMNWTLNSATLNGPGSLTNAAGQTLALTASTIAATMALDNLGLLVVENGSSINGTLTTAAGATIRVQGNGFCCGGTLTVAGGFTNLGAIELTSINGGQPATLNVTSGTLTNAVGGTISSLVGTGGGRTLGVELDNQGLVTVNLALTLGRASAVHSNSGTIALSGGDLTINQSGTTPSFTNTGTLTVGTGRLLTVSGGVFTHQTGATLSGGGALTLSSVSAGTFNAAFTLGALNLTSSTASFATAQSTAGMNWTLNSATLNGPGSLTNAAGQTLTLVASTIAATMALDNLGLLVVENGSSINGTLTTAAGATIRVQGNGFCCGGTLTVAAGFTNLGAIELTSINGGQPATLNVTSGTLTNAAGGTISSLVGTGGGRTLAVELDNQGLVTVNQALTLSHASADHTNSGTLNISGADLTLNQSGATPTFTNTGTVTIGSGRTWTVDSGTFTQQTGGTLNGGGTLALGFATATFNTALTLAALNLNQSTVGLGSGVNLSTGPLVLNLLNTIINGPGTITNAAGQTLTLNNSTIGATLPLDNQGTLVARATSAINGAFTTGATSTLRVEGDGFVSSALLTVATGFTNNGAIEITAINAATSAQLRVSAGTLTNAAGATIASLLGAGGARTLDAQLDNQGLITVSQALTLNASGANHTNSGTLNVSGADLTLSGTTPTFTNTGTVTIGTGRTWAITSGTFTHQSGATLTGGGTLTQTFGTADFNAAVTLGTLNLNSMTANLGSGVNVSTAGMALNLFSTLVNGPGTITNVAGQTLTLIGSNITASSALDNQGTLLVNGGSQVNGPLTTSAGSTIRVRSDGSTGFASLSVPSSGFSNDGAIELTSLCNCFSQIQANSGGTMTNAAGGTITTLPGAGGQRLMGNLNNQGTITVHPGPSSSGILQVSGNLTTSGTLNMELGGTTAGTGYSQITATGSASLGGTLNFSLVSFTPATGNTFDIVTASALGGTFTVGSQPGGWAAPTYTATTARLTAP